MPTKAKHPCRFMGCPVLTDATFCPAHQRQMEQERGNSTQRGYDSRWQKARAEYLKRHPLCVSCTKHGRITPATVVDHIFPHRGHHALFWDLRNWQALCKPCHDRKTATEDGGFGR